MSLTVYNIVYMSMSMSVAMAMAMSLSHVWGLTLDSDSDTSGKLGTGQPCVRLAGILVL